MGWDCPDYRWYGKRLGDMTKAELIRAFIALYQMMIAEQKSHMRDLMYFLGDDADVTEARPE